MIWESILSTQPSQYVAIVGSDAVLTLTVWSALLVVLLSFLIPMMFTITAVLSTKIRVRAFTHSTLARMSELSLICYLYVGLFLIGSGFLFELSLLHLGTYVHIVACLLPAGALVAASLVDALMGKRFSDTAIGSVSSSVLRRVNPDSSANS